VDVDTSSAKFAVTPQYFFNLLGDEGHHTVMGVGCVSNPTKTGFRVYLHRESGLTVDDANSKKWYIQWTAVGHDRRTGFVFHPTLSASDLTTLQTKQKNALGVYHTQLTGRITLLNNVNAIISNSTTGLTAIRIKADNAFDKGVSALTRADNAFDKGATALIRANNAFDKGISAFDKAANLETRAARLETKTATLETRAARLETKTATLETRAATLGNAINTNASTLAGIGKGKNVAKIDSSFSLKQGSAVQLSKFNYTL